MEQSETIKSWAETVIEIWIDRMIRLGVNNPFYHADGFHYYLHQASGGDVSKIDFVFQYFLKFTDMGVGRNVTMETRNELVNNNRPRRQWYNKVFLLEVKKLANILAVQYARKGVLTICENINDNALKWDKQTHKI